MTGLRTRALDRRALLAGLAALLGGCAPQGYYPPGSSPPGAAFTGWYPGYGPIEDGGREIPGLDPATVNPDLLRHEVAFAGPYRPGTIVVDVGERRLYLVEANGLAMRYTVGVGREEALNFRGQAVIGRKAEWPRWTPTREMIERMPRYAAYAGGMEGGLDNPLGARALYLYRGAQDTHFRLHGTNEPDTIGTAVSSGCIRLFNQDIIDLYNRVPIGTPVVVLQEPGPAMSAEASAPPPRPGPDAYPAPGLDPDAGPGPGPYPQFDDAAPLPWTPPN